MLIRARGRFLAAASAPGRVPRSAKAPRPRARRCCAGAAPPPTPPPSADDDEEPDRLGIYGDDMNPERAKQIVRALNVAYHINTSPMTGQMLSDLLLEKWNTVYQIEICIVEGRQVCLQIEPRPLSDADAKNKDNVLAGIGALLTEWGVADAAWREIAKHPAKRVTSAGVLVPLPVYYHPGRGARSVAGSRDDGDTNGAASGEERGGARDLMPPCDSWDQMDSLDPSGP